MAWAQRDHHAGEYLFKQSYVRPTHLSATNEEHYRYPHFCDRENLITHLCTTLKYLYYSYASGTINNAITQTSCAHWLKDTVTLHHLSKLNAITAAKDTILQMIPHTYIHTYVHTHVHKYIPTYIHTYIHIHIHTYIHTCMHSMCAGAYRAYRAI